MIRATARFTVCAAVGIVAIVMAGVLFATAVALMQMAPFLVQLAVVMAVAGFVGQQLLGFWREIHQSRENI